MKNQYNNNMNDYERWDFWFRETEKTKQNVKSNTKPSSQRFAEKVASEIEDLAKRYKDHILKTF